jgi:hypothetical protein
MRAPCLLSCAAVLSLAALAACKPNDVGYVEIRTVPVSASPTSLYLDQVKLEPPKNGTAVLRQPVGKAKLAVQGGGGQMAALCEIVVRKNRITTVTISVLERPPRCQCRNTAVGDPQALRSCIG